MSYNVEFDESNKRFISNRGDEHSAVCWNVSMRRLINGEENYVHEVDCIVRLQDCNRAIELCFGEYGKKSITEQALHDRTEKIDALIEELVDFRKSMVECYQQALEINKGQDDE